jgi:hypothetical protein
MRSIYKTSAFLICALSLLAVSLVAQGSGTSDQAMFVGVKRCKMCHMSKSKGNQYGVWKASKHADAYQALGTDKAKELAAKAGVKGNPQESDKCLKCHVTAFGVDAALLGKTFVREGGVQCEACHGPGSKYIKMNVMKDHSLALQNGLVVPDEKTCKRCHNEESPTFKGFDFKEYFSKIDHAVPKAGS